MFVVSRLLQTSIILLLFCRICVAEEPFADQLLVDRLNSFKSLSAEFSQTVTDAKGRLYETASGSFSVAEPNRVHWMVNSPMTQQIISDGNMIWIYDPDLDQVIIQAYNAELATSPVSLFFGNIKQLKENFDITYRMNSLGIESYRLTAKNTSAVYQQLHIDFKSTTPLALEFTDSLQQSTRIDLHKVTINPQLSDSLFTFQIPSGVDVINYVE